MRKAIIITFAINLIFPYLLSVALADDQKTALAVESVGEINAKDNDRGEVYAGMEADLILTIIAAMSQAEPGEEIGAIAIMLPGGFAARDGAVTTVKTGDTDVLNFEEVVDGNRIIVSLPTLIVLSSVITIEFTVDAPPTPIGARTFMVSLLDIVQQPIIISIQGGNADGRRNNDSLLIETVAATPPDPPLDVKAEADPGGENDIIVSWAQSVDPDVAGYFVYRLDRGDEPVGDVIGKEQTSYTDRSLTPGQEYSYTVRSYKTERLKSEASEAASAVSPADTVDPQPPVVSAEVTIIDGNIRITWTASPSQDVERYVIYRGESLDSREPIGAAAADAISYVDENPQESGSYLYAVVAVDDMGNESTPSVIFRRVLSKSEPEPNPFTPLSADLIYNQITFPATMLEGGEGVFAIKVFDLEGDLVFEYETESGEIKWDGKNMGEYVNSGIYVYQATMGSEYKIGTIIVAK